MKVTSKECIPATRRQVTLSTIEQLRNTCAGQHFFVFKGAVESLLDILLFRWAVSGAKYSCGGISIASFERLCQGFP